MSDTKLYPQVAGIFAQRAKGRAARARQPFVVKLDALDRLREAARVIREHRTPLPGGPRLDRDDANER